MFEELIDFLGGIIFLAIMAAIALGGIVLVIAIARLLWWVLATFWGVTV